jgi:hypothetical protein
LRIGTSGLGGRSRTGRSSAAIGSTHEEFWSRNDLATVDDAERRLAAREHHYNRQRFFDGATRPYTDRAAGRLRDCSAVRNAWLGRAIADLGFRL